MSVAVLDIDGVVADVRHRLHFLERRPKDWGGFFSGAADDPPLAEGVALARRLAEEHDVVWLTGRPDWLRRVTRTWLQDLGLPVSELRMRPRGDYRPARVYKVGVLRGLRSVEAFVDDDPEVIEAAQRAGFPAVLADWVPRDDVLGDAQERLGRS
jgi:hypothetical protein